MSMRCLARCTAALLLLPGVAISNEDEWCTERAARDDCSLAGATLLQRTATTRQDPQPLDPHGMHLPSSEENVVLPVPLYSHDKTRCIGAGGENPLLGDPLARRCITSPAVAKVPPENVLEVESSSPREEDDGHGVIFLLFLVLLMGVATMFILERFLPFVPYTAALFVEGLLIAVIQAVKRHNGYVMWPSFDSGVSGWANADPHKILFLFLPPLVFGESMSLNVSLVKACFKQCLLLAGPGVLIGAALTGAAAKYMLPYNWDWNTSMLFGAIVSATDPVAVVAIFNSLGVSPRLTMVISGESLFNDGTAYVLFSLYMVLCQGFSPSIAWIVGFFFQMTFAGLLVGVVMGMLATWFIGLSCEQHYHGDSMGQVVITVCCAYLSFFIAEELESSGMLALVASGLVVASDAWPRFIERETVRTIWHAIEFVGNTGIFVLAGIMFGGVVCERRDLIQIRDFVFLGLLYLASMLIRTVMVGFLWFGMNRCGTSLSMQEAAVIVWSGMRGAVGLLMAVVADQNPFISPEARTLIIFHAGGMAAIMQLINGPLTPVVLRLCGLMETTDKEKVLADVQKQIAARTKEQMRKDLESADTQALFSHADETQVRKMIFGDEAESDTVSLTASTVAAGAPANLNQNKLRMLRESFLRIVKNNYWDLIDHGVLARKSSATKTLLDSADLGMMEPEAGGLCDWESVKDKLEIGEYTSEQEYQGSAAILELGDFDSYQQRGMLAAFAFIYAHEQALELMKSFRMPDVEPSEEEKVLFKAIEEQNSQVAAYLHSVPEEVVTFTQNKVLARKLIYFQAEQVQDLAARGLISDPHARELEHRLNDSATNILQLTFGQSASLFAASRPRDIAAKARAAAGAFTRQGRT